MKISIITVCYNSEKYIKTALESVLNQTYKDLEYIIVDGLSTDTTLEIIKDYEPLFNGRMRWISEKDRGIYDAMNKGLKMATGDIVGLLNSDDFYYTNKVILNVAINFIVNNGDALYGDLLYVDANNTDNINRYWISGRYKKNSFLYGWMPPHPTFFVKRDVYEKYGCFRLDFKSAADYEFMLRVIHKERIDVSYLPEILIKMRSGGESNSSIKNRVVGNKEDRLAWKINNIKPYFFTLYLKPIRKIVQYLQRPHSS